MKTAKLFRNGQSQAVRLPKEYRLLGKEVFIKRIGNAVVLLSKNNPWDPLLESLKHFSPNFTIEREQPTKKQKRDELFS